jgi:hypothetical protein
VCFLVPRIVADLVLHGRNKDAEVGWYRYCENVCNGSVWLNMTPVDAAESQPPAFASDAACDVNFRVDMHDPFRGVTASSASENA